MSIPRPEKKVRFTGLTGGIATGKSRAAAFLARRFDLLYYSADKLVHDLLEPGREGWRVVRDANPKFINSDNTVNKPLLRSRLFKEEGLRKKIEAEIHPMVWDRLVKEINSRPLRSGTIPILVEVPLLYEAGWQDRFDEVIVVYGNRESCADRLVRRDLISNAQAEKELAVQLPLPAKCLLADHVIDNSASWARTLLELIHLGEMLWPEKSILKSLDTE